MVLLLVPPVHTDAFALNIFSPLLPVSPSHCRGMKPAVFLATFTWSWHYGGSLHSFTLTGSSSGPSGDVLRHGLQILVPKSDALLHPEAVTVRVHGVQGKVFLPNPCVEDFRHIGADLGQSFLFIPGQFFLGAFVVHSVEFIHYIVPNRFEDLLQLLGFQDVLLEVACIIMNEEVRVHLLQLHGLHDELDLFLRGFVDCVFQCCHHMPGMRVNHKLPSGCSVFECCPFLFFVCTGACALLSMVPFLGASPGCNSSGCLMVWVQFAMHSKVTLKRQGFDALGWWEGKCSMGELQIRRRSIQWKRQHLMRAPLGQCIPFQSMHEMCLEPLWVNGAVSIFSDNASDRSFLARGQVAPQESAQSQFQIFHCETKIAGDEVDAEFFQVIEGQCVDFGAILVCKISSMSGSAIFVVADFAPSLHGFEGFGAHYCAFSWFFIISHHQILALANRAFGQRR